jgi:nucleotide-binding universal stress UspA family protein
MPATMDLDIRELGAQKAVLPVTMAPPTLAIGADLFTDLLVAYDFSAAAATALEYAEELSRHFRSTVHLLSIETPDEHARIMSTDPRVREHVHQEVRRAFSHIETRLRTKGIPCNSTFRVGEVSSVLEGTTLECKTDLVILGAFGHGASDRTSLGSTAAHILRVADCPVLTVGPFAVRHAAHPPIIERLVCVTSYADVNHQLLSVCYRLASGLDATVDLLCVIDPEQIVTTEQQHEQRCEEWIEILRDKGIQATWSLLYGPPAQVIVAHANEAKASLVVLEIDRAGRGGPAPFDKVIAECIRQARCPVLTVPS